MRYLQGVYARAMDEEGREGGREMKKDRGKNGSTIVVNYTCRESKVIFDQHVAPNGRDRARTRANYVTQRAPISALIVARLFLSHSLSLFFSRFQSSWRSDLR